MSEEEVRQNKNEQESDQQAFYNRGNEQKQQQSSSSSEDQGQQVRKKKKIVKKRRKHGENIKKETEQRKKKQHLVAANQTAKALINQMKSCYEKDIERYEAKKKSNNMLKYSLELEKQLRNVYISEQFLENGGLQSFECWVKKLPDGNDSPISLKKKVFLIILTLNPSDEHIERVSELKKIIQKNKKNPLLRQLCQSIAKKWGLF